ncbi:MAG: hypothetical protein ABIQ44_15410, partial [Chloroflexia bacterium]
RHASPPRNPTYVLDWNGFYYLSRHSGRRLSNWHPSSVAHISSRFKHTLAVSEIWSYLGAMSRATHDAGMLGMADNQFECRYRLAVSFRNEVDALLARRSGKAVQHHADDGTYSGHGARAAKRSLGGKVLLQPDCAFTFGIQELHTLSTTYSTLPQSPEGGTSFSSFVPTRVGKSTTDNWESALLAHRPSRAVLLQSDELVSQGMRSTYYRTLIVEMETGTNTRKEVTEKIARYNYLLRNGEQTLAQAFGRKHRVLVVVRNDSQIKDAASFWQVGYAHKHATAVLLTSLQTLNRICSRDDAQFNRRHLLQERCWLDVMSGSDAWKNTAEALKLGVA